MLTNKHLLGLLVLLCLATALASVWHLFQERANTSRLVQLSGELSDSREANHQEAASLASRLDSLAADLAQERKQTQQLGTDLLQLRQALEDARKGLADVKAKKWVTPEEANEWQKSLKDLTERLKKAEERLKDLPKPPADKPTP